MDDIERSAAIGRLLDEETASDHFSGALLLARGEQCLLTATRGFAIHPQVALNRVDTRFNIASVTKMLTAIAVMQLVGAGHLALDALASDYDPTLPYANQVTVRQLLIHTAGFDRYWNDAYRAARAELRTIKQYLALIADEPLLFTPGTQHHYGNAGYVLLGALIERVTGMSYYDYMQKAVFKPAGMVDTGFFEMDLPIANCATGYTSQSWHTPDDGQRRANHFIYGVKGSPSEHCFSTVQDLLRFFTALRGGLLLSNDLAEACMTPQVDAGKPGISYGYGFHIIDDGRHGRVVGHGGRAMGGDAFALWYRDLGYTLIILSNYDRPAARRVMDQVADLLIS